MIQKSLNIGLIGAGRIGQVHAATITTRVPNARIVAVADAIIDAANAAARKFGIPKATADYTELIADPSIDAILICSPTEFHARQIAECARAGKHVFCEKPIALGLADIDAALAEVKRHGIKLQLGFNRRFDANYKRVRDAIAGGEIGQLHFVHIVSRDPAPPPIAYVRNSGGIFLDMTIHDFDMARFLVGVDIPVESLYVQASVRVDPAIGAAGDVDTAMLMLTFANGVVATIDNCRKAVYGYDQRVEAFGSAGAINTANNYPNSATLSTATAIQRDLPLNFFMQRYTEAYAGEIIAFCDAIANDAPTPVNGDDGREAVRLSLAAKKSHAEKRPVRLAEI
jgi:myo-inositol 2-dehydrogenase/D-chiro-inositol 1-dehydrogenase